MTVNIAIQVYRRACRYVLLC